MFYVPTRYVVAARRDAYAAQCERILNASERRAVADVAFWRGVSHEIRAA